MAQVPCGTVVYSLPAPLQIPMFAIVTVFWGLIQQLLGQQADEPDSERLEADVTSDVRSERLEANVRTPSKIEL